MHLRKYWHFLLGFGGPPMKAKYIVFDYPMHGETMFIFPDSVPHKDIARDMGQQHTCISAGFVMLRDGAMICFGESTGLGVQARPAEDGDLANMMFRRI